MKYFAGILLSALAIQTVVADIANIKSYIASNYDTVEFWEGVVLGLQQDPTDTTHECYTSFGSWATQIAAIPTSIENYAANPPPNSVMTTVASGPWYMPGSYFILGKLLSESGTVFFTFYDNCYIDDMLISLGRTINSISGAFNTAITAVTYFFNNYDTTDSSTSFYELDAYATADSPTDFGTVLGVIVTEIFNIQVPSVQYGDFSSSV
jgi:hypothetical protein